MSAWHLGKSRAFEKTGKKYLHACDDDEALLGHGR